MGTGLEDPLQTTLTPPRMHCRETASTLLQSGSVLPGLQGQDQTETSGPDLFPPGSLLPLLVLIVSSTPILWLLQLPFLSFL